MNAKSLVGGWGLALPLVLSMLVSAGLCADLTIRINQDRWAQDLVQAALTAEVSGQSEERGVLLAQAVSEDPGYAPARWHSEYVSIGGEWLSLEEVQRRAAADPRLAKYRRLRDAQAGTSPGELALARWCRQNGLEDQARFHWKRVLLFEPKNQEALKGLAVQWYQGRLRATEEIKQAQAVHTQFAKDRAQYRTEWKRWQSHWESQVVQWREAAKRGDGSLGLVIRMESYAVDFSKPIVASAAINSLHSVVLERSRRDKEQEPYRRLGLDLVKALDALVEPAATHSMVLYAVDHPMAEVRAAAADALKKRPKESYVPSLLARMESPIDSGFAIVVLPSGSVIYEHWFFREGADADYRHVRSESVFLRAPGPTYDAPPAKGQISTAKTRLADEANRNASFAENTALAATASAHAQTAAAAKATVTHRDVERANEAVLVVNRRVQAAIGRAAGVDRDVSPASPKSWANWWRDYCCDFYELESPEYPEDRPLYETYWYQTGFVTGSPAPATTYDRQLPAPPAGLPRTGHSCFPRGTIVRTMIGPMPIEKVKPGDLVLAQHPRSGELAFRPVLAVTERKPSERIKIGLGSDTLTATRGHPFWVCGEGWKMAKELKVGQRLHTVSGAVTIDGLEELPRAERWETADTFSYNLVVDDFHTYFVGEQKVMVHDNMLYVLDGPTGPLPGLARDLAAGVRDRARR